MKSKLLLLVLSAFIVCCTQKQELTQKEKDQIKSEVKAAVDNILVKFEKLDPSLVTECYWDSPDFIEISVDGSKADFQTSKKGTSDFLSAAASVKLTLTKEDYKCLSKDIVICAWFGKEEITLKTGEAITISPLITTLIFKNIEGKWKAIYLHESGTETILPVGKK